MVFTVVQQMECLHGCGLAGVDWISRFIGGVGLIVALGSMWLAWKSSKASESSAAAAEKSLAMARVEHEAFLRSLKARANFAVSLTPAGGILGSPASKVELHWQIKIENTGDKPAKEVVVIFIAPRIVKDLEWLEEGGDALLSEKSGARSVREDLVAEDGSSHPAQAITKITGHIGRFTKYTRVRGTIDLPAKAGDSVVLPLEVKVGSDDLPENMSYVEATTEITLIREASAPPHF